VKDPLVVAEDVDADQRNDPTERRKRDDGVRDRTGTDVGPADARQSGLIPTAYARRTSRRAGAVVSVLSPLVRRTRHRAIVAESAPPIVTERRVLRAVTHGHALRVHDAAVVASGEGAAIA
jgi:hypothetical protein